MTNQLPGLTLQGIGYEYVISKQLRLSKSKSARAHLKREVRRPTCSLQAARSVLKVCRFFPPNTAGQKDEHDN